MCTKICKNTSNKSVLQVFLIYFMTRFMLHNYGIYKWHFIMPFENTAICSREKRLAYTDSNVIFANWPQGMLRVCMILSIDIFSPRYFLRPL